MLEALVTGSNGFIGSHLVEALLAKGYSVTCLVRKTSDLRWVRDLPVGFAYGDVCRSEMLADAVREKDYIFHLGALTKAMDRATYFEVNYRGTRNLLTATLAHNPAIKRFLLMSSLAAAGPSTQSRPVCEDDECCPVSHYGQSKLEAERSALDYARWIPITIIRPPTVFGPRDRDLLPYFKLAARRVMPILGYRERRTSLIYVSDLVEGMIAAAQSQAAVGQTYFVSNDKAYTWEELSSLISHAVGKNSLEIRIPERVLRLVALISERIARLGGKPALINPQKALEMVQDAWVCDSSRAREELGFETRFPLEKAFAETVAWYRKAGWL